ncbi:hypothetical protein ACKFKG_09895 [Phormidesmis sp. 146-35]
MKSSLAPLSTPTAQSPNLIDLQEGWSFKIDDYAIEHQGNAVIDIEVSYDYVNGIGVPDPLEYPDFVPINNFIQNFLVNYPNETDFWEILNKNLVTSLLTQPIPTPYGVEYKLNELVDSLTVRIDVESGSAGINIPRSSIVTGSPKTEVYDDGMGLWSKNGSNLAQSSTGDPYDPLLQSSQATLEPITVNGSMGLSSARFLQEQGSRGSFGYGYNRGNVLDTNVSWFSRTQPVSAFADL